MDMINSWRHLFSAVLRLGADEGTVDERLREAYREGFLRVSAADGLPKNLQAEYAKLMDELDQLFRGKTVDVKRASRLAKRVVALYDRVSKEL